MKFYRIARQTHQITGLVLLLFTLLYFVTGYVLIHRDWFGKASEEVTTRTYQLERNAPAPENLSAYLQQQDRYQISGKRGNTKQQDDGTWHYNFHKAGLNTQAKLDPATGTLTIEAKQQNAQGVLVGLHRMHGYGGGWAFSLWALLLDLTSLAMILFALSGVYLWFKLLRRKRWLGWVLVGGSWAYTFVVVGYQVLAP